MWDQSSDEAKRRQLHQNQSLKAECMALEEAVVQLTNPMQHALDTWGQVSAKTRDADIALRRLLRDTSVGILCEFDPQRCMKDCGQQLSDDSLLPRINPAGAAQASSDLRRLARSVAHLGSRGIGASTPLSADAARASQEIDALERECSRDGVVDAVSLYSVIEAAVRMLRDAMGVTRAALQASLAEADERLRRLAFDTDHALEQQRTLFADGDVESAERKYYEALRSQEAACKEISGKFELIDTFEDDVTGGAVRTAKSTLAKCESDLNLLLSKGRSRRTALVRDLDALKRTAAQGEADHEEYTKKYQEEIVTSESIIEQNTRRQKEVWAQMAVCERELARLAGERYTEVQRRIQNFELSERHRVSYEQFQSWCRERTKHIQEAVEACDREETTLNSALMIVQSRYYAVSNHLGDASDFTEEERKAVHEEYLGHFQKLYLTSGDLLHKKEQVVAQLDSQIAATQLQLEICQDSLNPDAKHHAARKKELAVTRAGATEQLAGLQRQQCKYLEWFEPTETALGITGDDSRHPKRALEEKDAARRAKLDAYQALLTRGADDGPLLIADGEQPVCPKAEVGCMLPTPLSPASPPPPGRAAASPGSELPALPEHLPVQPMANPDTSPAAVSRRLLPPPGAPRCAGVPGRAAFTPQPPQSELPAFARAPLASPPPAPDEDRRQQTTPTPLLPGEAPLHDGGRRAVSVPRCGRRPEPARACPTTAPAAAAAAAQSRQWPGGQPGQLPAGDGAAAGAGQKRWGDGRSCDARADAILRAVGL